MPNDLIGSYQTLSASGVGTISSVPAPTYAPMRHVSCAAHSGAGNERCRNFGASYRARDFELGHRHRGPAWELPECLICAALPATIDSTHQINLIQRISHTQAILDHEASQRAAIANAPLRSANTVPRNNPTPARSLRERPLARPLPPPPDTTAATKRDLQSALAILARAADATDTKESRGAYQIVELAIAGLEKQANDSESFRRAHHTETGLHRATRAELNRANQSIATLQYRLTTTPLAIPANHIPLDSPNSQQLYSWYGEAYHRFEGYEVDSWHNTSRATHEIFTTMATSLATYLTTTLGAVPVSLPSSTSSPGPVQAPDGAWSIARPNGASLGCGGNNPTLPSGARCGNFNYGHIIGAPTDHHHYDRPLCPQCLAQQIQSMEPITPEDNESDEG